MRTALELWNGELWRPFRDFDRFWDDVTTKTPAKSSLFVPADVHETQSHYLFSFDVPGVSKEDIKIEVVKDELVVSGERKTETQSEKGKEHLIERGYGSFKRVFTLPSAVDSEKIEASYKDGVLKIAVPKVEEAKPRFIPVQ